MKKFLLFLLLAGATNAQTGVNVQKWGNTPVPCSMPVYPWYTCTATATRTPTPLPAGTNTPTLVPTATPTATITPTSWIGTGCFDAIAGNVVNLVSIRGSSTKKIRIINIRFGDGPSASTNGQVFRLLREATPSSGGTAGTPLNQVPGGPTPSWSYGYSTAGASVTPGTSSGTIRVQSQNRPTGALQAIPVDFGPYGPNAFGFTLRNQFDSLLLTIDATAGVTIHGCVDVAEDI